jgi:hypothetical protein
MNNKKPICGYKWILIENKLKFEEEKKMEIKKIIRIDDSFPQ